MSHDISRVQYRYIRILHAPLSFDNMPSCTDIITSQHILGMQMASNFPACQLVSLQMHGFLKKNAMMARCV